MTRPHLSSQGRGAQSNLSATLNGKGADGSRAPTRVLVVENHPGVARGLKTFLSLRQCRVEVASDVRAALTLAAEIEFDVLVCDLNLPDGTGWDLMAKLGKRARLRGIAYSALDQPQDVLRSQEAGFAEHLVKGCDPDELVAAIKRVFEKRRLGE